MTKETHRFKVGAFEAVVIVDGFSKLENMASRLRGVSEEDANAVLAKQGIDPNSLYSFMNCLYLNIDGRHVLADTGMGKTGNADLGHLLSNLEMEGVGPEDIDTLIITHSHGDHINGLITSRGEAIFKNAYYYMSREEWEFSNSEQRLSKFGDDDSRRKFMHILDVIGQRLTLVEDGVTILDGITAVLLRGHTPGHMGLMIESEGEKLFHVVDAIHMPVQMLRPDWSPIFDSDPEQSAATRRQILERIADENLLTLIYHYPFPALGHVIRLDDGFQWNPINLS